MTKNTMQPDINFLFEMGNIRFIERMWRRFQHDDFANLAEHHFRVFWIALVIAAHEGDVDTGKIAKLAILHDIAESRTGDVDYISRQYAERKEEMAITDMLEGTIVEEEFMALWHEYETRESKESQIVKDADNLDIDFELAERAATGSTLKQIKAPSRQLVADTKLYTETAKKMYEQLQSANPHDWWWQSKNNRANGGDWKQPK